MNKVLQVATCAKKEFLISVFLILKDIVPFEREYMWTYGFDRES